MLSLLSTFAVPLLALVALLQPWSALVLILAVGLAGGIVPGLQDVRGLSIIAVAGAAGTLPAFLRGELRGWPLVWPVVFFAAFLLNMLLAGEMDWNFAYLLAGGFCVYYLTSYGIRSRRQAMILAWAAILVGVGAGLASLFDLQRGFGAFHHTDPILAGRLHGMERSLVGNPNYFFPFMLPGMFFLVLMYVTRKSMTIKLLMLGALGVMVAGMLATLSRGTVVTAGLILLMLAISRSGRFSWHWLILVVPIGMLAALVCWLSPDVMGLLRDRFEDLGNIGKPGGRLFLLLTGLKQFASSPIWGVGLGATAAEAQTPHDGYMQILGEMGLIGFVLYYSLPFAVAYQVIRTRWRARRGLAPGPLPPAVFGVLQAFIVGLLVYNVFNNVVYSKSAYMVLAMIQLFLMASQGKLTTGANAMVQLCRPGTGSRAVRPAAADRAAGYQPSAS